MSGLLRLLWCSSSKSDAKGVCNQIPPSLGCSFQILWDPDSRESLS